MFEIFCNRSFCSVQEWFWYDRNGCQESPMAMQCLQWVTDKCGNRILVVTVHRYVARLISSLCPLIHIKHNLSISEDLGQIWFWNKWQGCNWEHFDYMQIFAYMWVTISGIWCPIMSKRQRCFPLAHNVWGLDWFLSLTMSVTDFNSSYNNENVLTSIQPIERRSPPL